MKYISILCFFFFLFLFLLTGEISASEGKISNISFAGVFDENIYNSNVIVTKSLDSNNQEIIEIIDLPLEILKRRKEGQLGEKYISILEEKIKAYANVIGEDKESQGINRAIDSFRTNPLGGLVDTIFQISSMIEGWFGINKKWGDQRLNQAKKETNPHLAFEILKTKAEIIAAYQSLNFEPVLSLEKAYVLKKDRLSIPLQTAIERSLILYRECSGHLLSIERTYVEQALSLASAPRKLIRDPREDSLRNLLSEVKRNFSTFSPSIQQELVTTAFDIANFSMVEDNYDGVKRVVRYFWGKPGGGKTTTILRLAEILELPIVKVSIRGREDLSAVPLGGEDRLSCNSGNKHGWFISPLLEKVSENINGEILYQTHNNAILLIDDIDLDLGADEVLSTLKLYLDPTTKTFNSPYFLSPIDISRMNVFVTSNQEIPKKPHDDSLDKYAALRSRVKQVEFPSTKIMSQSPVLREFVKKEASIRVNFEFIESDISDVINDVESKLISEEEEPDMRNMRAAIADKITEISFAIIDRPSENVPSVISSLRYKKEISTFYTNRYFLYPSMFFALSAVIYIYFYGSDTAFSRK